MKHRLVTYFLINSIIFLNSSCFNDYCDSNTGAQLESIPSSLLSAIGNIAFDESSSPIFMPLDTDNTNGSFENSAILLEQFYDWEEVSMHTTMKNAKQLYACSPPPPPRPEYLISISIKSSDTIYSKNRVYGANTEINQLFKLILPSGKVADTDRFLPFIFYSSYFVLKNKPDSTLSTSFNIELTYKDGHISKTTTDVLRVSN